MIMSVWVDAGFEPPLSSIGEAKPGHDDSSSGMVSTTSPPHVVSRLVSDRLGLCRWAHVFKLLETSSGTKMFQAGTALSVHVRIFQS